MFMLEVKRESSLILNFGFVKVNVALNADVKPLTQDFFISEGLDV